MSDDFRLLMIGAMYENGGNTTHRFFDGHPQMFVYPFESQLGTRLVMDHLFSIFPVKYRWPVFALDATARQDFAAIIDEETKVRACTPHVSKFRHVPFDFSDRERCEIFERWITRSGRSRAANVEAFFRATFDAWKDFKRTGREELWVGYSPILVVDADKILSELPRAHFLHVVRNPWSAYADTKKRPVPMSLPHYMLGWTLNQYYALLFKEIFPARMHIMRIEDVMEDSVKALGPICDHLGLEISESLAAPTWNGAKLEEVFPWGMIRKATPEANRATAQELTPREREDIGRYAWPYLEAFGYQSFV
jgi:hypothetical protein